MKLIYIAGPYSAPTREGVEDNIWNAVQWGVHVARLSAMPVIPHSNTAHPDFEHTQPYHFWIAGTLELLRRCDAAFFIPGWENSSGARGEWKDAMERGMPIFRELAELSQWLRDGAGKEVA